MFREANPSPEPHRVFVCALNNPHNPKSPNARASWKSMKYDLNRVARASYKIPTVTPAANPTLTQAGGSQDQIPAAGTSSAAQEELYGDQARRGRRKGAPHCAMRHPSKRLWYPRRRRKIARMTKCTTKRHRVRFCPDPCDKRYGCGSTRSSACGFKKEIVSCLRSWSVCLTSASKTQEESPNNVYSMMRFLKIVYKLCTHCV